MRAEESGEYDDYIYIGRRENREGEGGVKREIIGRADGREGGEGGEERRGEERKVEERVRVRVRVRKEKRREVAQDRSQFMYGL